MPVGKVNSFPYFRLRKKQFFYAEIELLCIFFVNLIELSDKFCGLEFRYEGEI